MNLDLALLAFIAGSIIPLATGVLTKLNASPGLKAFVSAFLSAVTAVVAYLTDYNGVSSIKHAVLLGLATWITHAGAYHGFWKPTGISGQVQTATDGVGVG